MDSSSPFAEPYRTFLQDLERAADDATVVERANEAFGEAMTLFQDGWQTPVMLRATEAFDVYRRTVGDGFRSEDAQAAVRAALRTYVQAVRDAWRDLQVESTDPAELLAIAEAIRSVAWLAQLAANQDAGPAPPGAGPPGAPSTPDLAATGENTGRAAADPARRPGGPEETTDPPAPEPGSGAWGSTSVLDGMPGSAERR